MKRKDIAILLEMIPLLSALISFIFIVLNYDSGMIRIIILITLVLAFLGFVFFFIGQKLDKESKLVLFLGMLDWLGTIYVLLLYVIAIFSFGL